MGNRLLTSLIVAPHPDDEVLGAGIWMHRHAGNSIHILHITDGSPRDMENARALGFRTRGGYAAARRDELARALQIAGVPSKNCTRLPVPDKEAYLNLRPLAQKLEALIVRLQPEVVLSPAYEGGHPDHDAAAFAVALVHSRTGAFQHLEFPLYHADKKGRMITGRFISPGSSGQGQVLRLSPREQSLKSQMLACFETQTEILSRFRLTAERFRRAGVYDFTKPPHPGPLLYERWGWGITGAAWRARAREALSA